MKIYLCTHKQIGNNRVFFTGSKSVAISWVTDYAKSTKMDKDAVAKQTIAGWDINGTNGERVFRAAQLGAAIGDDSSVEIDGNGGSVTLKEHQEREVSGGKVREWRFRG